MVFSKRYQELIYVDKNGNYIDNICGEIEYSIKRKIALVLLAFSEPQKYHPSRYDDIEKETTAFEIAITKLSDILEYSVLGFNWRYYNENDLVVQLACIFTPYLFDVIELQYIELSNGEKTEFEKAINDLFMKNDIPWLIHDGKLIKIDAKQFELDIKAKTILLMKELKEQDVVFQVPFDEMSTALEFYRKGNYAEVITNAEKSYESVLKILCDVNRGNADKLTNKVLEEQYCKLPQSMNTEGFREKVLMSLPYIRNNSTACHGSGKDTVSITKEMANLAINMASALNTYLIESFLKVTMNKSEE